MNKALKALALEDKDSSMEGIQNDPMAGANVELQMSKEEFMEFMKTPIRKDEIENPNTFNQDKGKQTQTLPKSIWLDECMPDMISQGKIEIGSYYKKDNSKTENLF